MQQLESTADRMEARGFRLVLESAWRSAKRWRKARFGRLAIIYRLARNVPVSSNTRRALGPLRNEASHAAELAHPTDSATSRETTGDQTAVIVGVGPGFGFALARRLAKAGMNVALASRNAERLDDIATELRSHGRSVRAYGCDATSETSVSEVMSLICSDMGVPQLVVFSVQGSGRGHVIDVEPSAFEEYWRQNCLGGFIVGRESARRMKPLGRGTIILVGSTSSLIGRADHVNLSVGKFGLRALSQVMARELWSSGVHVAHLVIDADIQEADPAVGIQSDPLDIADVIYAIHRQRRTAWTSELDVRPWNEQFWEHC